jgi:hypothetical protein
VTASTDHHPAVKIPVKPRLFLDLETGEVHEIEVVAEEDEKLYVVKAKPIGYVTSTQWTRHIEYSKMIQDCLSLELKFVHYPETT